LPQGAGAVLRDRRGTLKAEIPDQSRLAGNEPEISIKKEKEAAS
jgi:hypothetical protein